MVVVVVVMGAGLRCMGKVVLMVVVLIVIVVVVTLEVVVTMVGHRGRSSDG